MSGLVPAATDPNREAELKRLQKDPKSFGNFDAPRETKQDANTLRLPTKGK